MAESEISFARGAPSPDLLPAEQIAEAAAKALESDWQRALSYGGGAGHSGLLEWLAERHGMAPEQLMLVNGSLQGATLLFGQGVGPGDRVVVEDPSYDRTLLLLEQLQADLAPIVLDDDGLSIDALEQQLQDGQVPRLVHVIPHHHNPAGSTLSEPKRQRLVALAAEHRFAIFEDDPYVELGFDEEALPTMLSLDEAEAVVYASSFSKTVAPGVRIGYLAGPSELIGELRQRANEQYISPNMLAESIVWQMAVSGSLEANIQTARGALRERCHALCDAVEAHLPDAAFLMPAGGYFLWLTFPDDVDADRLAELSAEQGATFEAGSSFSRERGGSSVRLAFASVRPDEIDEGVQRIARALEQLREQRGTGASG